MKRKLISIACILLLLSVALFCKKEDDDEIYAPFMLFCTMAGCLNGVNITFNPALADSSYNLSVTADGISGAFNCRDSVPQVTSGNLTAGHCSANSFFLRATPAALSVTAEAENSSWQRTGSFSPQFVTSEPNGPGCGTCTNASVEMN